MRAATDLDREFLISLFASTRQQELAALGDDEALKQLFVAMQYDAQCRCYPEAENTIAVLNGTPIGRILIERNTNYLKLVDIALLPEFRNKGIGSFLLERLLREAQKQDVPVTLHVFKSSDAVRLYERNGFQSTEDDGTYLAMQWRHLSN